MSSHSLNCCRKSRTKVFNFARRTQELQKQLAFIMESEDKNTVFWIEWRGEGRKGRGGQCTLSCKLHPLMFRKSCTASCLTPWIPCSHFSHAGRGRQRREILITSASVLAWNIRESWLCLRILITRDRPCSMFLRICLIRDQPSSATRCADKIRRILEITRGHAFCLFTSYAQMNDIHDRLLGELPYPMLLQGTAPKNALLEEFRITPNAVLFATSSFWQGVDVQGQQLSCVIIDRLPFAVPSDPIVAARVQRLIPAAEMRSSSIRCPQPSSP